MIVIRDAPLIQLQSCNLYRFESESDMSSGSDSDVMITSVVSSVQLAKYVN